MRRVEDRERWIRVEENGEGWRRRGKERGRWRRVEKDKEG